MIIEQQRNINVVKSCMPRKNTLILSSIFDVLPSPSWRYKTFFKYLGIGLFILLQADDRPLIVCVITAFMFSSYH